VGDMGDVFRDMREHKRATRDERFQKNMQALMDSGVGFSYDPERNPHVVLLRAEGVSIDFYPGTGRWKDNLRGQAVGRGGAAAMLRGLRPAG
jgi:hypothetical protein